MPKGNAFPGGGRLLSEAYGSADRRGFKEGSRQVKCFDWRANQREFWKRKRNHYQRYDEILAEKGEDREL